MNYKKPEKEITVKGVKYEIDTDFRTWAAFACEIENTKSEKDAFFTVANFVGKLGLPLSRESLEAVLLFFCCGETESDKNDKQKEQALDFKKDEELITAAFRTQYGIDLRSEYLHWWDFLANIKGLKSDLPIVEIMGYRTIDLGKVDKSRKAYYRKLKNKYSLRKKHYVSLEDRDNALKEHVKKIQERVSGSGRK